MRFPVTITLSPGAPLHAVQQPDPILRLSERGVRAAFSVRERGWDRAVTVLGREEVHAYERLPLSRATLLSDAQSLVHPYAERDFTAAAVRALLSAEVARIETNRHRVFLSHGDTEGYEKLLLAVVAQPCVRRRRRATSSSHPTWGQCSPRSPG